MQKQMAHKAVAPDGVSHNGVIGAYERRMCWEPSAVLLEQMVCLSRILDVVSFGLGIGALEKREGWDGALALLQGMTYQEKKGKRN